MLLISNFDTRCISMNTFRIQNMGLTLATPVDLPVAPVEKSLKLV